MRRISIIAIISVFIFINCKKTKLEGDLSVLVGTWEWRYTVYVGNICEAYNDSLVTHSPSMDGFSNTIKFLKKGKMIVYLDGKKDKTYRLIRKGIMSDPGVIAFNFNLDNDKKGITLEYFKSNAKSFIKSNYLPLNILNGFDGCRGEYSIYEKLE